MMFIVTYECDSDMAVGGRATREAVTDACSKSEAKELFYSHPRAKELKAVITHINPQPNTSTVFI